MAFQLYDLSVDLARAVRGPLSVVSRRDPDLARQLRRAVASVPLNVAEGNWRAGADRAHLWRVAAGSAAEVRAALHVAEAFGYVGPDGRARARALRRRARDPLAAHALTRRGGRACAAAARGVRATP